VKKADSKGVAPFRSNVEFKEQRREEGREENRLGASSPLCLCEEPEGQHESIYFGFTRNHILLNGHRQTPGG
jgi:hypothetical protein